MRWTTSGRPSDPTPTLRRRAAASCRGVCPMRRGGPGRLPGSRHRSLGAHPTAIPGARRGRVRRGRPADVAGRHGRRLRDRRRRDRHAAGRGDAVRSGRAHGHARSVVAARRAGTRRRHPVARPVVDWTFATTDVIRLECFIEAGNDASDRMVERVGFQREGLLRAWELGRDGQPIDCIAWSRLRSDAPPRGPDAATGRSARSARVVSSGSDAHAS